MNAFESGQRKLIPAVLIYAERDNQFLMLHRNAARTPDFEDYHKGKWNGLGGKCEANESPLETAMRELEEESGLKLEPSRFKALGTLQFPDFKAHKNEDWIVFVFLVDVPKGFEAWQRGPEGDLVWIVKEKVLGLNLWAGDKYFIPMLLERRPFLATLWYEGQDVRRHWIQKL